MLNIDLGRLKQLANGMKAGRMLRSANTLTYKCPDCHIFSVSRTSLGLRRRHHLFTSNVHYRAALNYLHSGFELVVVVFFVFGERVRIKAGFLLRNMADGGLGKLGTGFGPAYMSGN